MKRLRSHGDDLVGFSGEKELDRASSFSSSGHRRFYLKLGENGRSRPGVVDDDRDRETPRGSRKRIEYDVGGLEDGDGSRGFRQRSREREFGNGFDSREGLRGGVRKYHDLDSFDERGEYRVGRKRVEYDVQEGFEEREGTRGARKGFEHDNNDGLFDRRKGFDRRRERDGNDKGGMASSIAPPRDGYLRERERIHRSESFGVVRREIPKGFRSERDRSKREDSVSSWRSISSRSKKEAHEEAKTFAGEKPISDGSKGGGNGGSSREGLRSPQTMKDMRSPTWSKDSKGSGGETFKPAKKNESLAVESGGSSNAVEVEEGELQPDPHPENERQSAPKQAVDHESLHANTDGSDSDSTQKRESVLSDNVKLHDEQPVVDLKEQAEVTIGQYKIGEAAEENILAETACLAGANAVQPDNVGGDYKESLKEDHPVSSVPANSQLASKDIVEVGDSPMDTELTSVQEVKVGNSIDLESQAEVANVPPEPSTVATKDDQNEIELQVLVMKDKGKGVAVCSPSDFSFRETDTVIKRYFTPCSEDAMEGPSTRGFELFSTCVGKKVSQSNVSEIDGEKLKLEGLDLSLGLPGVSLPVSSSTEAAPPNSPPQARSIQSLPSTFRTGSDCFTTSVSYSGSHFVHNPSCSLTHNSVDCDLEQSVKSRPLFQGFDWHAHSANDSKHNDVLAFPKVFSNANGSIHSSIPSPGVFTGQPLPGLQAMPFGLDRSGSFKRQLSGVMAWHHSDVRSPTQSVGSRDTRSECGKDKKHAVGEERGGRLFRIGSQTDMESAVASVERIIPMVVSEPIDTMSWRIREMSEQAIASLKDLTREIIEKEDRLGKLHVLQGVLKNRTDLTLESLLKSHHVQMEILVALKTGLTYFLQRGDIISLPDMAEIFLCLKCRNPDCRIALPVDDCECKFCSGKAGFCSSCMCLVCSKFDTASNTCSWVGCDMCNHWCHADCGLQNSYIRNGHSVSPSQGTSEMHFYCVACNHPSEMFGFVKDVFNTCAPEWKAETMLKELEHVKRIFSASNDIRGKLLHDLASNLFASLENGGSLVEVRQHIMAFLSDSDSKFTNASGSSGRDAVENKGVGSSIAVGLNADAAGVQSFPVKSTPMAENIRSPCPKTEGGSSGIRGIWTWDEPGTRKNNTDEPVLGSSGSRGIWDKEANTEGKSAPEMDELEGIVKIKQAEAQMFKKRADDARREAEALQRIATAKSKRVEEEFAALITKLCLGNTEERRRQKLEELQMLERSHREYSNMKARMEADIKDLLLKMEATKRNLRLRSGEK